MLLAKIQITLNHKNEKNRWPKDGKSKNTAATAKVQSKTEERSTKQKTLTFTELKAELNEFANKQMFKEKTADIQAMPDKFTDKSKVRKGILKFISIFHPDKQNQQDKEFYLLSEEITKQLNK